MEKGGKRKIKDDGVGKDDHGGNEKKKKKSKVEAKPTNNKIHSCLNIHNNVLIKMVNENKRKFEKVNNVETMYTKIKASITSLNVSSVLMDHYNSFIYYEKNKMDFLLPELDAIVNSSNIDVLKGLSELSFFPIYHETLRKRIIEWLAKDRGKKQTDNEDPENMSMSYWFSLNLLLTYLIYKNDQYSSYASLVHLNLLQWMQRDKRRLHFRLFTLKGILKRFLTCSFYFNDKEVAKLEKVDSEDGKNENEGTVLKNVFMALNESIEYLDVSNLVNINDKNCIFELIKFFLQLVRKPLINSIHILCINYLIKIVRRCYDLRLTYNINVELYDIGPEVNIFVKIVNLIFAKILLLLKETRNEESIYSVDQINNMNNLIILFFTNVVNSCIRVIVPQVLFNEKLKRDYLSAREGTSPVESQLCFEDQVVANACNPVFSFIEIFIINNHDRSERNLFLDLIKSLVKLCRKIESKYNVMRIICDEYMLFVKDDENKKRDSRFLDKNYLRVRKISRKRIDSSASFTLEDDCSSSVCSESEGEEVGGVETDPEADADAPDGALDTVDPATLDHPTEPNGEDAPHETHRRTKKKTNTWAAKNRIQNKRKSTLVVDQKSYSITYESVMVRYLNILIKYINCEKYQIRSIILDLFLALMKKKKTNKNESIFLKLFKLFLERLEDPNMVVRAKALSILGILTNRKYHNNNSLVYKFIFNKTKEKINMYKIISGNIFSHKSNIRKLTVQYIEAIFETLIGKKLSYKLFLIFISNYMYCLSLDAMPSVRRQILLTVNNLFINASEDVYVAKMWLSIILAAITDIEETVKDEAISLFLNTFIKSAFQCPILKANEKTIKEVLAKNKLTYFRATRQPWSVSSSRHSHAGRDEEAVYGAIGETAYGDVGETVYQGAAAEKGSTSTRGIITPHEGDSEFTKEKNKSEKKDNRDECDKNNNGVLLLIDTWKTYFGEDVTNYFLTLLRTMIKYDLQNFNLMIFCLKRKKNNSLEEFISVLNSFMYNLRYFSIKMWNIFLLDFVIELSKEYRHSVDIGNVLFLLRRCYRVYLLSAPVGGPIHIDSAVGGDGVNRVDRGDGNEMTKAKRHGDRPTEEPTDDILTREELLDEMNTCSKGVLKNIMLKLFTIVYNLLDTIEELNEDFMKNLEYAIFQFNCPLCLIYIILNILIKKKKDNVSEFIDKLKYKICFFFEIVESVPQDIVFCNILITFIFLMKHFKKEEMMPFLTTASQKLKKIYDQVVTNGANDNNSIMVRNCIYLTQSVLLIDKGVNLRNDLFLSIERDLKNGNTSMNILNNLIILTYYMIINFGSSCNKFVYLLLRFFKHENSFIRYLSFYMISKLISEDYIKFSNHFFFAFLYLLADKNETIQKQSLSVFKHILLIYNKANLINYIIEFIFVLNNFYHFKMSKHLANIGNSYEIKEKKDRYTIYHFLLENLNNSEKFSLQQKLINDYLIQYVYNYDNFYFCEEDINEKKNGNKRNVIPLNDEDNEGAVLQDVLNILSSKLMKIKIKKDFTKLEEKNKNLKLKNVENSVKVLNDLMKNILKKNTLPILLSLRAIMLKAKSFFYKHINNLIIYLCLDYRDSLEDLIPEVHVRNELANDLQNFTYVDLIQLHTDQDDPFRKNNKVVNINVNFLELSQNEAIEESREWEHHLEMDKRSTEDYRHSDSESDYDEVHNVLHGIHDVRGGDVGVHRRGANGRSANRRGGNRRGATRRAANNLT
ncbi:condensin-2 complex subunit D3 [Plasmodium inui San Antonio 1]|uniref:Condensin-2 complex subunit D3 n=1 Tax=Plasmodium inui San Antonio 1 TaxID=1237626 RepID=W7A1W4_9APIC|nr:condensin-2 complex subunit D3 [Plasmodium inui San Antonio 1]EUD67202.1 condensin-2 complex subunit D3 [Plasmodium inui San Antonio 1]